MRKLLIYIILLGTALVMSPSCGGSKQSASMRKIEKQSKKIPMYEASDGTKIPLPQNKKARQAVVQQMKKKEANEKATQKSQRDAIKQHRELQSPEVRARMDQNLKETNKRQSNKKEFFVKRWFRPKDDVAKIEKQRAKETEKRKAATLKKAEKTNEQLGLSSDKKKPRQKKSKN